MSDTANITAPEVALEAAQPAEAKQDTAQVAALESLVKDEHLKEWIGKKGLKNIDDALKSHMHLESLIGKRVVDMTPEELKMVNTKFGAPESADKYTLTGEDKINVEFVSAFKEAALKAGIHQQGADHLFKMIVEKDAKLARDQTIDSNLKIETNKKQIEDKYGAVASDVMKLVEQELLETGGEALARKVLNLESIDLDLVDAFYKNAKAKLGHTMVSPSASQRFVGMTPAEARQEIDFIRNSHEYKEAKAKGQHERFKQLRDRLESLYVLAGQAR